MPQKRSITDHVAAKKSVIVPQRICPTETKAQLLKFTVDSEKRKGDSLNLSESICKANFATLQIGLTLPARSGSTAELPP